MADGRNVEKPLNRYRYVDFDEIWDRSSTLAPYSGPTVKISNFLTIHDGDSRRLENHRNRNVWANLHKIEFQNPTWRTDTIFKMVNRHIFTSVPLILMKFAW